MLIFSLLVILIFCSNLRIVQSGVVIVIRPPVEVHILSATSRSTHLSVAMEITFMLHQAPVKLTGTTVGLFSC